jgi:hypothetical protein
MAGTHAHVERLVSVVKIATVLEECTIKEPCSSVCFCGEKNSMQELLRKKASKGWLSVSQSDWMTVDSELNRMSKEAVMA